MRGEMYECTWFQGRTQSRTRALWVPDASLLFQWSLPRVIVKVTTRDYFPPPETEASVTLIGTQAVPYRVVRAARQHLRKIEHFQAQEALLQGARIRNANDAFSSEEWLRELLLKVHLPR